MGRVLWLYIVLGALTVVYAVVASRHSELAPKRDLDQIGGRTNALLLVAVAWPLFWAMTLTSRMRRR